MAETQLTKQAHDRLKAELEDLTTRGRAEVADLIERARALGDLSENGDYHAAKEQQGVMEQRIRTLEAMLESAVVVDAAGSEVVAVGSTVGIRYEGDDDVERYLVGSIEEKGEHPVISPESPLGKALLGARPGDTVEYAAPSGTLKVEVVELA